jgi:LuxR family maltose regulon positive regulatory protein
VIERLQLFACLDRAIHDKLTLVCAPAGYGKSTLLGTWLMARDVRSAWLSLDEHDDGLARFTRALVAAIQTAVPAVGRTTLALLNLPDPPTPPALAMALDDELSMLPGPLVVVLDDYQRLATAAVHDLVSDLLRRLPDPVHLIVSTRTEPPLPLASLRAEGQLTEIRAEDLRFGRAEASTFLKLAIGDRVSEQTVTELLERTEGWPAGLRLAAVLLRDRSDRSGVLAALMEGSHEYVRDYLLREVLAKQPADVRRFVVETSILDRFSASLCGVVVESLSVHASREMLERIARGGVMLVALDKRGEWFRYHHLFQELLRGQLLDELDPAAVSALHRRAARWLAGHGQIDDAVRHLLAADDVHWAAALVEASVHPALNREDWPQIAEWLDLLPTELVNARPALLLARAWVLYFLGRITAIPPILELAETLVECDSARGSAVGPLRGELDTLWSEVWLWRGDPRTALDRARHGEELLTDDQLYARGFAAGNVGVALHRLGRGAQALGLTRAQAERETGTTAVYTARLMLTMGYCYLADGQYGRLESEAWVLLALARSHRLPLSSTWTHYGLGRVYYEWNDLGRAVEQYSTVIERRHEASHDAYRDSALGLALAYQVLERPQLAEDVIRPLVEIARELGRPRQLALIRSFQARVALMRGDIAAWSRWADMSGEDDALEPPGALEEPRVTRAWALLARGDAKSLSQAIAELALLERQCVALNDTPRLIQVLALQALVFEARGDRQAGLAVLERALASGRRGGFIRTFVDLGPPMAEMLGSVAARGRSTAYLERLLAVFATGRQPAERDGPAGEGASTLSFEALTWREQDVLKLLNRRLSNKEIAQALGISPLTVKKHAESIYRKLHARGRRNAVERAQSLGLVAVE